MDSDHHGYLRLDGYGYFHRDEYPDGDPVQHLHAGLYLHPDNHPDGDLDAYLFIHTHVHLDHDQNLHPQLDLDSYIDLELDTHAHDYLNGQRNADGNQGSDRPARPCGNLPQSRFGPDSEGSPAVLQWNRDGEGGTLYPGVSEGAGNTYSSLPSGTAITLSLTGEDGESAGERSLLRGGDR